jgi:hypothetical protein
MPTQRKSKVFATRDFQETVEENINFDRARKTVFTDKVCRPYEEKSLKTPQK